MSIKRNGRIGVTKEMVRDWVDEAGLLQVAHYSALKAYNAKRTLLIKPLEKLFGTETYVVGTSGEHQAVLHYKGGFHIDVIDLINNVGTDTPKGRRILRNILSVKITEASKTLNVELKEALITTKRDKKPTLLISRTNEKPEDVVSKIG